MPNGGSQNEISILAYSEEVRRRKYMTVQEALNKATEGGYHSCGSDGMDTDYEGATNDYSAWTRKDNESSFLVPTEETFLDPQFWQALGRALGWSAGCDLAITCVHGDEECRRCRGSYCLTVAPKMHSSLASRINSASEGIRRPLEPLVAHLCSVAPHQFGSTSGAHDVFLCFQGLSGVDAVYRRDSWLLLRA